MAPTAPNQQLAHQPPAALNSQAPVAGSMSLNTRIPTEISNALLAAWTDRKIQRQSRATQQDIVAEALQAWLKKHGYLG